MVDCSYPLQNARTSGLHKISTLQSDTGECRKHSVLSNSEELCLVSENTARGQTHFMLFIMQSSYIFLEWLSGAMQYDKIFPLFYMVI